ncbi:hypothetical protein RHGRI_036495 [Rhododendron griersonianum]|uniref:Uncharacterized protein n=1 Tax=Rhododendron griersonianum TaxID=479676 RepID=A0AAV6HR36_9ERIC|nr:hypothetical protein RHGRI_036495 [Rhododendron griersonianum]
MALVMRSFYQPKVKKTSVYSDDDESSRFQAKVMGPGKKRGTSTTQILRKSQRNQEEGGSSNGATSTLPGQPLANHGQVMSVVAANDQHAGVPTTPNCLGEQVKKKKGPITRHYSSKDAIKCVPYWNEMMDVQKAPMFARLALDKVLKIRFGSAVILLCFAQFKDYCSTIDGDHLVDEDTM